MGGLDGAPVIASGPLGEPLCWRVEHRPIDTRPREAFQIGWHRGQAINTQGAVPVRYEGPSNEVLRRRLETGLDREQLAGRSIQGLGRVPALWPGKFYATEEITLALTDGVQLRVFAKHGPAIQPVGGYRGNHTGGLAYEGMAHATAMKISAEGIPVLLGEARDAAGVSLFFQLIENAVPAYRMRPEGEAMIAAGALIGAFHRRSNGEPTALAPLNVIDRDFLLLWEEKAFELISEVMADSVMTSGLRNAVRRTYLRDVDILLQGSSVLVHGDYWTSNVIGAGSSMWIIDWEMAAAGPGEIDLATITIDWPEHYAMECEAAYAQARWPGAPPQAFSRTLAAARRFTLLRILTIAPARDRIEKYRKRVRKLADLVAEA